MNIKIGNYYLVETKVGDLIVEVKDRLNGIDSYWSCDIYNKDKFNIVKIRRKKFKVALGDSLEDSLKRFPEYFI